MAGIFLQNAIRRHGLQFIVAAPDSMQFIDNNHINQLNMI